ncbi:hypothetical protein RFI_04093, partial [Reticulomyxa filosa]
PTIAPTKQPTTKQPTKKPTTKKPTLATYTCNGDQFSGDFSQATTSTALFSAGDQNTAADISICVPDTQVHISVNSGSDCSANIDGGCDSNPACSLPASSVYIFLINVTYLGGTKQAWTLDIVCSAQRRLQSSTSLKLANSVTFSVIQSDCTPNNWQQDISGTGSAISQGDPHFNQFDSTTFSYQGGGPHILYQLDTFQIQGLFVQSSSLSYVLGLAVQFASNDYFVALFENDDQKVLNTYVNCQQYSPSSSSSWYNTKRYRFRYDGSTTIIVQFYNGIYLKYFRNPGVSIYVPFFLKSAKGQNGGLLGNFNGNANDDCYLTNGANCCSCSSWQQSARTNTKAFCRCGYNLKKLDKHLCSRRRLFEDDDDDSTSIFESASIFESTSSIFESTSIFGSTSSIFESTSEAVVFDYNSLNNTEKEYLNSTCDSNYECMYDLYFTNNKTLALATKDTHDQFVNKSKEIANNFACSPSCQNNATCLDSNICQCVTGFAGDRCENDITVPTYNQTYLNLVLTSPTISPTYSPSPSHSKKSFSSTPYFIVVIVVVVVVVLLLLF